MTIGADYPAREAIKQLQDADLLQTVTSADVLTKSIAPITDTIRQEMHDREFLDLCEACSCRWIILLTKMPQDLLTY